MKRFIMCFILSLIGLSMLMQPAIAYNDQDTDTVEIYNPFYHVFFDTTLDETTYVKGSYIETPYLIVDSAYVGGKVKISNTGVDVDVVAQAFKAEYNITSQLGAWVHGVKVELTRTVDIQPATGCWFGGQFVLNAGTSAWDDINKPAYAVQGIIKGDQWDGTHDVNAARFELQSSGSVRDIVYILANSGTSVSSSMMYMPTHISLPYMINMNVQSNATVTSAIHILSGGGGSYNYGLDLSSATINTADLRLSNGALVYNKHPDSLTVTEANVKIIGNFLATTYLNLPVPDSAVVAASAHVADSAVDAGLLDGYNEDYFLDTNDVVGLTGHDSTNFLYSDTVDIGEFISVLGTKVFEVNLDSNYVHIGEDAGTGAGTYNLFIGTKAGQYNTTGSHNTAVGYRALDYNYTGSYNFALGSDALRTCRSANYSVGIGKQAMYLIKTASDCIAIGREALYSDSTGGNNVAAGTKAGYSVTLGIYNVFIGTRAGEGIGSDGNYYGNVVIGGLAGLVLDGNYSTLVGYESGYKNTGNNNTAVGRGALYNNVSGVSNLCLGYQAGYSETGSNKLHIAVSATDSLIYGEFDNHYLYFKDSVRTKSFVVDRIHANDTIMGTILDIEAFNLQGTSGTTYGIKSIVNCVTGCDVNDSLFGIYAEAVPTGDNYWAGYFSGKVEITENLKVPLMYVGKGSDIASASTITVSEYIHDITGTATIDSIVPGSVGQLLMLQFDGTAAPDGSYGLIDGKNLKLAGNLEYTPNDVINLYCDGSNWFEISRSIN